MVWGGEKMGNGLHDELHGDVAVFTPPRSLLINQFLQPQMAAPCYPRGRALTGAAARPWGAPRTLQSQDTAQLLLQRAGRRGTAVLCCRAAQFQPLSGVRECAETWEQAVLCLSARASTCHKTLLQHFHVQRQW